MSLFEKPEDKYPQLNIDTASKLLENVFKATDTEPNSIPLEVLTAYSNYRKERFSLQRTIIVLILVLFFMLPFLFIPSEFSLNQTQAGEHENPTYNLEVTSKMLVRSVVASVDGSNVPVYETDAHVYSIEPAKNGKMAVTVTLMNNQTATQYVDVENVDFDIPVLVSNNIDAENVYLFLSDAGSGIDYDNIRALTLDGREVSPASVDTELGRVTFTRTNDSMNIYIPDFKGNELHLVLTIQ